MGKKKGAKAAAGRAKQKHKAQKSHSSPWSQSRALPGKGDFSDDDDDADFVRFRGFAQTKSPRISTPASSKLELRHHKINFVSAGVSTPPIQNKHQLEPREDENTCEESDDDIDIDDSKIMTNIIVEVDTVGMDMDQPTEMNVAVPQQDMANMHIQDHAPEFKQESSSFIIDVAGDETLADACDKRVVNERPLSPASSDTSEDVIVFHGRAPKVVNDPFHAKSTEPRAVKQQALSIQDRTAKPATCVEPEILQPVASAPPSERKNVDDKSRTGVNEPVPMSNTFDVLDSWQLQNLVDDRPRETVGIPKHRVGDDEEAVPNEWKPAPSGSWWREQNDVKGKFALEAKSPRIPEERVQIGAEETIASLQRDVKQMLREKKAMKKSTASRGHDDESNLRVPGRRGKKGRKTGNRALRASNLMSGDDDDAAAEAAYDDYMANLAAQLDDDDDEKEGKGAEEAASAHALSGMKAFAETVGLGGPCMVVDGREIADDEVLLHRKGQTTDTGDDSAWISDDSDESSSEVSEDDDSELEDEIEYNEEEMYEDEEDLRLRRIEQMEDEEIARLFAKQEEFGIDNDDLIIDAGEYAEGIGDIAAARAGLRDLSSMPLRTKRRGRRQDHFPDATALADSVDQYGQNGFDIMDFDRPSLRPTKKGRKGKIPPELEGLSDEELKNDMLESWDNDRRKKSQKKLEREELRMQGLLGKAGRNGKADLTAKYSTGMTIQQVYEELADFLMRSDLEQRAFPPMSKQDRKALHEICGKLNMNSKSQGAGHKRFPVITKTQRTPDPGEPAFESFISEVRSGRMTQIGHAYRMSKVLGRTRKGKEPKVTRAGRSGGAGNPSVAPRHGEVVGGMAARIGSESFGHRMMQKMGWTEGRGLGQSGEGLVDPVEQRMRFGTAGLG